MLNDFLLLLSSHQVRPAWIPPLGDGQLHPEEQSGSSRREVDCKQRLPTLASCYLGKLLTNSGLYLLL